MKKLIGALCICVGVYLADYPISAISFKAFGHSWLDATFNCIIFILPFVSALILTVVGFVSVREKDDGDLGPVLLKVILTCFVAVIPIVIHFATLKAMWSLDKAPVLYGPMPLIGWCFLVIGSLLVGLGAILLARRRKGHFTS